MKEAILDFEDHETVSRLLREERDQLILAWEQLEMEQRRIANQGSVAAPIRAESAASSMPSLTAVRQLKSPLTDPNPATRASNPVARKTGGSNPQDAFRLLRREFDKPQP